MSPGDLNTLEEKRLALQAQLDSEKSAEDRNRMGQFATPTSLARDILTLGVHLLPKNESIRFLDPGIGTGSFYSALRAIVPEERIESAVGFEIDPHYAEPAKELWQGTPLTIRVEDFTSAATHKQDTNLLICNPPYVRHHHLGTEQKTELQHQAESACGVRFNKLSGLYCYYMGLAHRFMAENGVAAWLVPSEFMGVNYGRMLKRYLLEKVTLLHVHRYDPKDVQFNDALVSSAVVLIRNTPPRKDHMITFSYGGSLETPALSRKVAAIELTDEPKWTRYPRSSKANAKTAVSLGDLFNIKRGIATGDNSFFIMTRDQIEDRRLPMECFVPVLPGSRHVPGDEIHADGQGLPIVDRQLYLLNTRLSEDQIAKRYPALAKYLASGKTGDKPVSERYLCRGRRPWYSQETRPPAPIICTYMGRSKNGASPFRFILNNSCATACNTYLLFYPKPLLASVLKENPDATRTVWEYLNKITPDELLLRGRVYGGGLHKLEPRELSGFPVDGLMNHLPEVKALPQQLGLF